MEPVNKVPGLTFHVEQSTLKRKVGKAELHADVNDPDMWEDVLAKLDGFRVYTVKNLQESVLEVLQQENEEEKKKRVSREGELLQELAVLRQRCSLLETQNAEYVKLKRELHTLKGVMDLQEFKL